MRRGAISSRSASESMSLRNKVDSVEYCTVLQCGLIPFMEQNSCAEYDSLIFLHDRIPSHISNFTRELLTDNSIATMDWPAMNLKLK